MTIQELRDQRAQVWEQAKALNEKAKGEKRLFTPEEEAVWAKMNTDLDAFDRQIKVEEQAEARAREFSTTLNPGVGRTDTGLPVRAEEPSAEQRATAFDKWLRFGPDELDAAERAILNPQRDKRARASTIDFNLHPRYVSPAFRTAQSAVTGAAGGYTVPQGFVATVEASMKAFGGMRQASRILPTDSGQDLPWPTVDDTAVVGELLAENTAAAQKEVTFGQIIFKAYKYSSKEVLVPTELIEDSAFNLDSFLAAILGERISRITNTHFTTGDNSGKPQGVVVASSAGKTAASATVIVVGELIDLFHSVDPAYRSAPQVAWMFNDSTFAAIRKLTLADWAGAQAVWQPGLAAGEPDRILGKPYFINQDMASITNSAKTVLFGDFSKYIIRDVAGFRLRRLVERYAEKDQVSFIAFSRHDGRTLDAGTDPIKHLIQLA